MCLRWATLPVAVAAAFRERFGAEIIEGYGLSETTGVATSRRAGDPPKEGSVGRAIDGCVVEVLDSDRRPVPPGVIGEVAIDGPTVLREYWRRPRRRPQLAQGAGS